MLVSVNEDGSIDYVEGVVDAAGNVLGYLMEHQRPFLYWYLYPEQYKNFRLIVG